MKLIEPGPLLGNLNAPPSKSAAIRAVLAAALAKGESRLFLSDLCDDLQSALRVAEALGAETRVDSGSLSIRGTLAPLGGTLHCGESALCARAGAILASLFPQPFIVSGAGSLLSRSFVSTTSLLRELGANVDNVPNLPFSLRGPIQAQSLSLAKLDSSQNITGLLMALPLLAESSEIEVYHPASRGYLDLTASILSNFGITLFHESDWSKIHIPGSQSYSPTQFQIEGDWSGAAFLLVGGALAGSVTVRGLSLNSSQPDRSIVQILRLAGALVTLDGDQAQVRAERLSGFEFDLSHCPDLFPAAVALAMYCEGRTVLHGSVRLRNKESNRETALVSEYRKLGGNISAKDGTLVIDGSSLSGAIVSSHGDHRIAMSLAVAAKRASSPVAIDDAGVVSKSYPSFFLDLEELTA